MSGNKISHFKKCIKDMGRLNMFYIKALQALSTNTNLLTQEQMDFLSVYTDNVPFDECEVNREFIQSLEDTASKNGYMIQIEKNSRPIKSGMISLIYSAKLNSLPVVVKVMRTGVRTRLDNAFSKVMFVIRAVSCLPYIRDLQLIDVFTENRTNMIAQTFFNLEKENIMRMANNCKHTDYINVPTVYPEFTDANDSIIVMSYLEGRKLEELHGDEKDEYCRLLAKFGMKCLLFNRFYHADLHPGNILFMKDPSGKMQLGILDYGIMGEITKEEQKYFHKFFTSLTKTGKNYAVADNILNGLVHPTSLVNELSTWDYNNLREEIGNIAGNIFEKSRNFTPDDMFRINTILRKHNLTLSKSFCRIELSLAVADSVSSKLCYKTTYIDNVKSAMQSLFETSIIDF